MEIQKNHVPIHNSTSNPFLTQNESGRYTKYILAAGAIAAVATFLALEALRRGCDRFNLSSNFANKNNIELDSTNPNNTGIETQDPRVYQELMSPVDFGLGFPPKCLTAKYFKEEVCKIDEVCASKTIKETKAEEVYPVRGLVRQVWDAHWRMWDETYNACRNGLKHAYSTLDHAVQGLVNTNWEQDFQDYMISGEQNSQNMMESGTESTSAAPSVDSETRTQVPGTVQNLDQIGRGIEEVQYKLEKIQIELEQEFDHIEKMSNMFNMVFDQELEKFFNSSEFNDIIKSYNETSVNETSVEEGIKYLKLILREDFNQTLRQLFSRSEVKEVVDSFKEASFNEAAEFAKKTIKELLHGQLEEIKKRNHADS